jgi:predicted DNA-binding ArsR family transcriptional regulator
MKTEAMEAKTTTKSGGNKGGRPKKSEHINQRITVMCTLSNLDSIRLNAKEINLTVSEYLRELGLKRQVGRQAKVLPKEVLQLIGTLNHMAANLNQIAYKRNRGDELNALERAELIVLSGQIKELAKSIKAAIQ